MSQLDSPQRLWSRRALGCYGFLFSPTFGAILEAWDWHPLDRRERNKSLAWAVGTFVAIAATLRLERFVSFPGSDVLLIVVPFFVWYLARGRRHSERVLAATVGLGQTRNGFVALPFAVLWAGLILTAEYLLSAG